MLRARSLVPLVKARDFGMTPGAMRFQIETLPYSSRYLIEERARVIMYRFGHPSYSYRAQMAWGELGGPFRLDVHREHCCTRRPRS
jgi:hypothetical protein